jgi:hypothetical protein
MTPRERKVYPQAVQVLEVMPVSLFRQQIDNSSEHQHEHAESGGMLIHVWSCIEIYPYHQKYYSRPSCQAVVVVWQQYK